MRAKNYSENAEQTAYAVIIVCVVLIVLLISLYQHFRYEINTATGWIIKAQLFPFSPFFELPRRAIAWLSPADMGRQTFRTMLVLLHLAGRYSRWIILLVFVYWIVKIFRTDVIHRYMFTVNMRKLLRENAKWLPCLSPVIDEDILSQDIDRGPWRAARQALQFCVENRLLYLSKDSNRKEPIDASWKKGKVGLVLNRNGLPREDSPCLPDMKGYVAPSMLLAFDEKRAHEVFVAQLGNRVSGNWSGWPGHVIGLAASFMAFASGDKDIAKKLLDHMSLSFKKEKTEEGHMKYVLNTGNAHEIFRNYMNRYETRKSFELHGMYFPTLLMSLLMQAKRKGVLESSQYIWLRPYDRTLWYSLNQMGGYACWAEAAGPWAHYQFVEALGERSEQPQCQEAVNALKKVLQSEGWLPAPARSVETASAPKQSAAPKGPKGWAR